MNMGVPPGIISEGMDDHYHGRYSIIQSQGVAEKGSQALIHALTRLAEELSVIFEEVTQDNRDAEEKILTLLTKE